VSRLLVSICLAVLCLSRPLAAAEQESLLAWLEISTAAGQAGRLISQSLDRYPGLSDARRGGIQAQLEAAVGSEPLVAAITEALSQQAVNWEAIEAVYQLPIARRARNFEAALMLSSAAEKFETFRAEPPVSEARLALARRIDGALQSSRIAVILQTGIDAEVARLAGGEPAELDDDQQRARQQAMAEVAASLYVYAYRFLKDDELSELVEAMESPAIRQLTDAAVAALPALLSSGRDTVLTVR